MKPDYYKASIKGVELDCLDVIEALGLDFHLGNAMKYLWRAGKKEGASRDDDLAKAAEYIRRAKGTLVESVPQPQPQPQPQAKGVSTHRWGPCTFTVDDRTGLHEGE